MLFDFGPTSCRKNPPKTDGRRGYADALLVLMRAEYVMCFDPRAAPVLASLKWWKTLAVWIKVTLYVENVRRFIFLFKSRLNDASLLTGWKLGGSVHIEGQQGAPWQSHLWEKPGCCGRGEYCQVLNKMPITRWDLESRSSWSFLLKKKKKGGFFFFVVVFFPVVSV